MLDIIKQNSYLLLVALCSVASLGFYYDIYWHPIDDGVFSYLATQINSGKIFGVDFLTNHPGYHSFLNAWFFRHFGDDMVVLRYPVILMTIAQAIIVAYLLKEQGAFIAFFAGFSAIIMGFLQYPNASPNWICLFWAFCTVLVLLKSDDSVKRNILLGILIGTCFMFRHPSGIFLGFGVLAYLIYESGLKLQKPNCNNNYYQSILNKIPILSKFNPISYSLLIAMIASLLYYSSLMFEPFIFLVYGIWPIMLLIAMLSFRQFSDQILLPKLIFSAIGIIIAIMPMALYQLLYGDFGSWFVNSLLAGNQDIYNRDSFSDDSHIANFFYLIYLFTEKGNNLALFVIIYQIFLFSIPTYLGFFTLKKYYSIQKNNFTEQESYKNNKLLSLAIVTIFFGYVSFYFQAIGYVYFTFPLFVLLWLYIINDRDNIFPKRTPFIIFIYILYSAALYQSPSILYYWQGRFVKSEIEKVDLYTDRKWNEAYKNILPIIKNNSDEDDYILTAPFHPELYFLSNRRSSTLHYATVFYNASDEYYQKFWQEMAGKEPELIIINRSKFYLEAFEKRLLKHMEQHPEYEYLDEYIDPQYPRIFDFIIYRRKST